jgi:molecular chaperone DnaK (HSP70)
VVVVCDFGGSGTSITLVDADARDGRIGDTFRLGDFSGDLIDQAILRKAVAELGDAGQTDPSGTAMVGSLTRLREGCRLAKHRLSGETATGIAVDLPGQRTSVRLTRTELENLLDEPLAGFLAALDDTLERNGVPAARVSAVATIGGGARIPLLTHDSRSTCAPRS